MTFLCAFTWYDDILMFSYTVSDDISVGNQSGKEGDLSPLYNRVLEIVEAVSKHEAEKSAGSQLKLHLNDLRIDHDESQFIGCEAIE